MRGGFYPKIAWTGIRKNSRLYTPYILTCAGMVMMYYIISFLNTSSVLVSMKGGSIMMEILGLGTGVICVFSVIFLFYTNSFLIRRRKKEFGLYNILGMGKKNLAVILIWETLIIAVFALTGGLLAGIAFSKFAELAMVNIIHGEVTFSFSLGLTSIWRTLTLFSVIFLLILLNTLRQIQLSNPIELLHSESAGEKPPKANWILALAGVVILAAAYYLAVTIEDPIDALVWFFVAVIMVIIATYLLFIAGSVVMCRLLQKNKNYYYKTNHFVSISSMVYRMKRNGAGLATICILCTMVLVMISSTGCLYIGMEDTLKSRYPKDINLDVKVDAPEQLEGKDLEEIYALALQAVEKQGWTVQNTSSYRVAQIAAYIKDDSIWLGGDSADEAFQTGEGNLADIWQLFLIPVQDYNALMGEKETLEPGEVLIYTTKEEYNGNTVTLGDMTFQVKETVTDFIENGVDTSQIIPSMFIFLPDNYYEVLNALNERQELGSYALTFHWLYGFDTDGTAEEQVAFSRQLSETMMEEEELLEENGSGVRTIIMEGAEDKKIDLYGLYGGLFFLGILLGTVFIFAAVLIMYYKQISEGYEDQSRFEIMQKVGMTKKDIRRSINSQVLTVFFLPLLIAGVHLAFAFPMIYKMLLMLGLSNQGLLIGVTVICYLIFALFYIVVYRITSRSYYTIVSGVKE